MKKISQILSFTWLKVREYCDPAFEGDPWGFRKPKKENSKFQIPNSKQLTNYKFQTINKL
jgi:hypothetical protein